MEQFVVSARKYRPVTFDTVVGQHSITVTLKNAIKSQHLAQAYLFCGPRGVGKTTCARIFAKTINCFQLTPEIEPCNECESCKSFVENRSFNIHELDAASNNSVDDIRLLIEKVRIPPQVGKYSIYIIDEVHMLSSQAFNAFLKTLEEPPRHAIFILATTEKHKIIPTILSRCQIFDFNRIEIDDTVQYLSKIAANEGIDAEPDALNIIAQKADGAMRDALSIYDQVIIFSDGKITYQNVIENLNVLDYDYYFRLTEAFISNNITNCLIIFDEILRKGFDTHNFITGLSKHFRDLLVCKDTATIQLLEVGASIKEKYKNQSAACDPSFLFEALNITNDCDLNYRISRNQRLHVELALFKLCQVTNKKKTEPITDDPLNEPVVQIKQGKASVNNSVTKVEAEPLDTQKPIPILKTYTSSTPSLKSILNDPLKPPADITDNGKGDLKEPVNSIQLQKKITPDQLFAAFNGYIVNIKSTKPRLYNALSDRIPQQVNETTFKLTFDNQAQCDDFTESIKSDLTEKLRTILENSALFFETEINQIADSKDQLYTADEKYKHLQEKNPLLGKLKQQMNLEYE